MNNFKYEIYQINLSHKMPGMYIVLVNQSGEILEFLLLGKSN